MRVACCQARAETEGKLSLEMAQLPPPTPKVLANKERVIGTLSLLKIL